MIIGCSGEGDIPVVPMGDEKVTDQRASMSGGSQTHLWGMYDCWLDLETMTVEAVPNRQSMFTANVVQFINGNPANLGFGINKTIPGIDYIDVDIDVSITHPFPGMYMYNGYDVRGVFVGNGSTYMKYDSGLNYPRHGTDQTMLADPYDPHNFEYGKPDGYTRWYNRMEFTSPGLCGYTDGLFASKQYFPNSRINPYKYFADGIGPDTFTFSGLEQYQSQDGVFTAGETNTRNYYIRFPNSVGVRYAYAVIANWEEGVQPSNATEAVAVDLDLTEDVWYLDSEYNGGEIVIDFKVWDWDASVNASGVMQDYVIKVDSTCLSSTYDFTEAEMTVTDSGDHWHQYHAEVITNNVTGTEGNEFWLIIEYPEDDYQNPLGVPNSAGNDPLAAFFRYDLPVANAAINQDPICDLVIDASTPSPADDFLPVVMTFDATGSYDPDPYDTLHYSWDFDGDGIYDEAGDDSYLGDADNPTHLYYEDYLGSVSLIITDGNTGEASCSVDIDVRTHPSKNIELRSGVEAYDIAVDHTNGDLLISYSDNTIYKYTRASCYTSGALFINTIYGGYYPITPYMIDMAPNQYMMVGGVLLPYDYTASIIYDPTGSQLNTPYWLTWQATACDIVAMGSGGSYDNDLCFMHGYIQTGIKHNISRRHISPAYTSYAQHDYSFSEIYYSGHDKIYFDYIVGCESDQNDDCIWMVEDADYYASRWRMSESPYELEYDNAYFGTGSQTTDNDGFYRPMDITRDDENRLFVLDEHPGGEPKIKIWTVDGDTTTHVGVFGGTNAVGDTGCINGAPLRIEGSDYNGDIVVLILNELNNYRISVFNPAEMPGFLD